MAIPHAGPGAPVDLRPENEMLSRAETHALVKDDAFEAIRMVVPKEYEVCHDHHVTDYGPVPGRLGCARHRRRQALTQGRPMDLRARRSASHHHRCRGFPGAVDGDLPLNRLDNAIGISPSKE